MLFRSVIDVDIANLVGEDSFKEINDLLEDSGIPKEYVNQVIENKEIKEYFGEYASDAVNYVLYQEKIPTIEEKELTDMLIKSFDKVVEEVNNTDKKISDQDIKKVHSTINKYVPKIIKEIPNAQELIDEELKDNAEYQNTRKEIEKITEVIDNVKKAYEYKYVLVILAVVGLALMLLIKFKSSKLFNWLRSPFFTAGLIFVLLIVEATTLMKHFFPSQLSFLRVFIDNNLNQLTSIWKRDAIIYFSIFVVLVALKIVLSIIKNKRENEIFELNEKNDDTNIEMDSEEDKEEEKISK